MEEKNTVLVQSNMGLEEELRKASAAKGQLETYKRQVGVFCLCVCTLCVCARCVNHCLLSAAGGGAPEPAVGGVQEGRQDGVRVQEGEGEGGVAAEGERRKEVEGRN